MRIKAIHLAAVFGLSLTASLAPAQKFAVVHEFDWANGGYPSAPLIRDAQGNLYGTTYYGGSFNYYGTVFALAPNGKEKVLYNFNAPKGANPDYGSLLADGAGNFYGSTEAGGDLSCHGPIGPGCGTVFKLDSNGKQTVLYSFNQQGPDYPLGGLVRDGSGNLYGTTLMGTGSFSYGSVFRLNATTGQLTVLYSFTGPPDGAYPEAGLVQDSKGNLYGTTFLGGVVGGNCFNSGCGTVFELTPDGKGGWSESLLYRFNGGKDGSAPSGLLRDSAGNLYGVTAAGGNSGCYNGGGCGTAFRVSPISHGGWDETVLYRFAGFPGQDGAFPWGTPVQDASGNLYGTTVWGGGSTACPTTGCGLVFKLDSAGKETVLRRFSLTDGAFPYAGLLLDSASHALYGTTSSGGGPGQGLVFKLSIP